MANSQIVHALRSSIKIAGFDGMLLPVTDEYQGEYVAAYAKRVEWLCGFDGSAGTVIVLEEHAALLTDGRYTLQAQSQLKGSSFEVKNSATQSITDYIVQHTLKGARIAYDPWLHTAKQIKALDTALSNHAVLIPHTPNPVDALWADQPPRPCNPIFRHDDALAGRTSSDKIADVLPHMRAETLLITQPDAICWLLNIRGADVPYNPLPLCYAIVSRQGQVVLFIDPAKVPTDLTLKGVRIIPEFDIASQLPLICGASLQYDPSTCPIGFIQCLQEHNITVIEADNPITALRSIKNPVEQENIRRAHRVDGVAVKKFLGWFDGLPATQEITELELIDKLETFRCQHPDYKGVSFATICGAGEHGAIVHYRATSATNRKLAMNEALLVDSGGQYPYGTTDITRTLWRGTPSEEFKRHFTLVLKGHIALAKAIFPEGTTGHQLDILARQYLWNEGLDYAHGTGHGVGHYLCVHEGPQSISTRSNGVALKAGMILSNEPGYYKEGAYGIRIESLVLVVEKHIAQDGTRFLGFETLTYVPIDIRLVDRALMSDSESQWLEAYNQSCNDIGV